MLGKSSTETPYDLASRCHFNKQSHQELSHIALQMTSFTSLEHAGCSAALTMEPPPQKFATWEALLAGVGTPACCILSQCKELERRAALTSVEAVAELSEARTFLLP